MKIDLKEKIKITPENINKYVIELIIIYWQSIDAFCENFNTDTFDKIELLNDKFVAILNAITNKIKGK